MKRYVFKVEDFIGSGQCIIKTNDPHIINDGYLSTIIYKIGYLFGEDFENNNLRRAFPLLISIADGWTINGHYIKNNEGRTVFKKWMDKKDLVDFLNNNPYNEFYRPASKEEIIRVINYQGNRFFKQN
jgi:hypothetical protein